MLSIEEAEDQSGRIYMSDRRETNLKVHEESQLSSLILLNNRRHSSEISLLTFISIRPNSGDSSYEATGAHRGNH